MLFLTKKFGRYIFVDNAISILHSVNENSYIKMFTRKEVFLRKGVLKICSKFTGEHECGSAISIMFLCNFTEMALRYGCSPVSLLHIFRTPFSWNSSGWLLLNISDIIF